MMDTFYGAVNNTANYNTTTNFYPKPMDVSFQDKSMFGHLDASQAGLNDYLNARRSGLKTESNRRIPIMKKKDPFGKDAGNAKK